LLSLIRLALAGGQEEQPWLVKSSTTTLGRSVAEVALTENPAADIAIAPKKSILEAAMSSLLRDWAGLLLSGYAGYSLAGAPLLQPHGNVTFANPDKSTLLWRL
jgi:hypothetical protein